MDYEPGGDLSGGGNFLDQAGTYHLLVSQATETPTKKNGEPIHNAVFGVTLEVLAGTVADQDGRIVNLTFFHGKPGEEKSIAMAKKKMDRFFIATNVFTPEEIEQKVRKPIDIEGLTGQQIVAKFDKEKEDSRYVDLSFADIHHVDDKAVSAIPKNAEMLALIAPSQRWPGGRTIGKATSKAAAGPAKDPEGF